MPQRQVQRSGTALVRQESRTALSLYNNFNSHVQHISGSPHNPPLPKLIFELSKQEQSKNSQVNHSLYHNCPNHLFSISVAVLPLVNPLDIQVEVSVFQLEAKQQKWNCKVAEFDQLS